MTARLTPTGRARLRACAPVVRDVEASLGLEPDEVVLLNALLHRVLEAP